MSNNVARRTTDEFRPTSTSASTSQLWLCLTDSGGNELIKDMPLGRNTVISSEEPADIVVPTLHGVSCILRGNDTGLDVMYQEKGVKPKRFKLQLGEPFRHGDLVWHLSRKEQCSKPDESLSAKPFVSQMIEWASEPMNSSRDLNGALTNFVKLCVNRSKADKSFLVTMIEDNIQLVSAHEISSEGATNVWKAMPEDLKQSILRQKAKVLLPQGLTIKGDNDATVFVSGMRSMVGFPILAEEQLLGILFLGFDNILARLSRAVQIELEQACFLVGLVMQRAVLRQELCGSRDRQRMASGSPRGDRLMIGSSWQLAELYEMFERLAPVDLPMLVTGETGVGKELAAQEIHRLSHRGKEPFVAINAAALPETLFESELFGHKRGSFTGALSDHIGHIERADKGTLFIDEVAEMPMSLQVKLLRVLQEKAVQPLGHSQPRSVDFRLVVATHQPLEDLVRAGSFREDLYYRIAGSIVRIPSLRERLNDILELAQFFKQRFSLQHRIMDKPFSAAAIDQMLSYPWPGNVRQLQSVVTRALVMCDGHAIRPEDLEITQSGRPLSSSVKQDGRSGLKKLAEAKEDWLRDYLTAALKRCEDNRGRTARCLGVSERTLFRYLDQLGMN